METERLKKNKAQNFDKIIHLLILIVLAHYLYFDLIFYHMTFILNFIKLKTLYKVSYLDELQK